MLTAVVNGLFGAKQIKSGLFGMLVLNVNQESSGFSIIKLEIDITYLSWDHIIINTLMIIYIIS